jgi:nucleoid DNA-binding protein
MDSVPFRETAAKWSETVFQNGPVKAQHYITLTKENLMTKKDTPKSPTKSEILNALAESTGLARKDVGAVLDALNSEIEKNIARKGSVGMFTIPGLCKIVVRTKPALPKRQVRNPGTGEMVWAKPRPARKDVKIRPLKGVKDMVN